MIADTGPELCGSRVDLAATADFDLGDLRIRAARLQVCAPDGTCREIEPRVMQVLVALASARGEVVSRDRLIETCWDGRIVGDDAINRCIVALRHLAKEFEPAPFVIETVPRVGYYLVEREAAGTGASVARRRGMQAVRAGALLALLVLALAFFVRLGPRGPAEPTPASLAVLPFRDLSGSDPNFAEGLGEEILGQLAREPQFRVAGRTSSSLFRNPADLQAVGRKLGVAYVLEGSVRTQDGRVRVNAALVQTGDGMRLWSQSYDGRRDDIFAIQQRIGGAIATALKRELVRARPSGPLVTNGEVHSLYLTARGLLRTRKSSNIRAAADLLRRAVELDPGYAPAWSSLGAATGLHLSQEDDDRMLARQSEAARYARHALRLAPDLAEAHGTLGMVLGFWTDEGAAHVARSVQLDPHNAETLFWLGQVYGGRLQFAKQREAYRRAAAIDPLLMPLNEAAARLALEMGYRDEAAASARRLLDVHPVAGHIVQGQLAFAAGNFSEAARIWAAAADSSDRDMRSYAGQMLGETLRMFGLPHEGRPTLGYEGAIRRSMSHPPSRAELRAWNRNPLVSDVHYADTLVGAKLILNNGRSGGLLNLYDAESGVLGFGPRRRPKPLDLIDGGPVIALALRRGGRTAEAEQLLVDADAAIAAALRQGRVPFWFHAAAARVWAVQGRRDRALAALERAVGQGWVGAGATDLIDLGDEPAFVSLRGQPRFERLHEHLRLHMARERLELVNLRL